MAFRIFRNDFKSSLYSYGAAQTKRLGPAGNEFV
jgi:hypothetical protein